MGRVIDVNALMREFYERVDADVGELTAFDEVVFYAGSSDADLMVVTEADGVWNAVINLRWLGSAMVWSAKEESKNGQLAAA